MSSLTMAPIGTVRSPLVELADAPRQPGLERALEARIELARGRHLEHALSDIETWRHLWVLFWFHRAEQYRPKVQPPRSERKRGVLATRSPHRPNPIGLSVVELVRVEGLTLTVRGADMIDGTPVLDLKPYLPYADALPEAGHGWLDDNDPVSPFAVDFSPAARAQLDFLAGEGLDLEPVIVQRLALGPAPQAYRRIRRHGDHSELSHKDWRIDFIDRGDHRLEVLRLRSGYRPAQLFGPKANAPAVHHRFVEVFG